MRYRCICVYSIVVVQIVLGMIFTFHIAEVGVGFVGMMSMYISWLGVLLYVFQASVSGLALWRHKRRQVDEGYHEESGVELTEVQRRGHSYSVGSVSSVNSRVRSASRADRPMTLARTVTTNLRLYAL